MPDFTGKERLRMSSYQGLTVRHHDRHELDVPAELIIAPEHVEQVRFTGVSAGAVNATTLSVKVRDMSRGGVGLESPIYLPRMTKAVVRMWLGSADSAQQCVERLVRVRRCLMASESPSYMLGTQFISREGEEESELEELLRLAGRHDAIEEDAA